MDIATLEMELDGQADGLERPEAGLRRVIERALRGSEAATPRDSGRDITVVLELDGRQFGKAVYRANNEERQRAGVDVLAGG